MKGQAGNRGPSALGAVWFQDQGLAGWLPVLQRLCLRGWPVWPGRIALDVICTVGLSVPFCCWVPLPWWPLDDRPQPQKGTSLMQGLLPEPAAQDARRVRLSAGPHWLLARC